MVFASRSLVAVALLATVLFSMNVEGQADDDGADLYDLLGIGEPKDEASEREIKKQYRTLSRKLHPDLNPSEEAKEKYAKVQRAYEVLSDRKKRKIYDMKGDEGLKQLEMSEKGQGQGHMDPFAAMFGMGGGGGNNHKGKDVQMRLNVPLEYVYKGYDYPLTLTKQKLCRKCRGSGAADRKSVKKCGRCKGRGVIMQRIQLMPGFVQEAQNQCPDCKGTGKTFKNKCKACHGKKVVRGEHHLEVEIEKGVPEGHKLVYEMEADQHPDLIPGDVIFTVHTKDHSSFKRKGDDLETTIRVTLKDALLGFSKNIVHMDGRPVELAMASVSHYGQRVKITGEGMPKHNVPSEKGDLYVIVEVQMPRKLTEDQKTKLKEVLGPQ